MALKHRATGFVASLTVLTAVGAQAETCVPSGWTAELRDRSGSIVGAVEISNGFDTPAALRIVLFGGPPGDYGVTLTVEGKGRQATAMRVATLKIQPSQVFPLWRAFDRPKFADDAKLLLKVEASSKATPAPLASGALQAAGLVCM